MNCPICNEEMIYLKVFSDIENNGPIIGKYTCFNCSNTIISDSEFNIKDEEDE